MQTRQIVAEVGTDSLFALRSFRRAPGWTLVTLLTASEELPAILDSTDRANRNKPGG